MRSHQVRVPVLLLLLLLLMPLLLLPPSAAASSPPDCEVGEIMPDGLCGYYEWVYTEPDWCLYSPGDEVQRLHYMPWYVPYAWYVTPASDPGRDGDWYVMPNCQLFQYPW